MTTLNPRWEVLERHKVAEKGDAPWQQILRLSQALWREEQGLPIGTKSGGLELGSRIDAAVAERDLSNFLTETIRRVFRETLAQAKAEGKLIQAERARSNLLSSQPLCFNLFGELKADFAAASAWARHLWPDRVREVTRLEFEYSPGRRDERYLGNRTAFDAYLEHTVPGGGEGFIGFEVKYHEALGDEAEEARDRLLAVARESSLFADESLAVLQEKPLWQIWFDHLLALSMLQADAPRWKSGLFVLLHPVANEACYRVVCGYEQHLGNHRTFQRLTLEEAVAALRVTNGAPWVEAFQERYLDMPRTIRREVERAEEAARYSGRPRS